MTTHVIYLSPPKGVYADERVTQGLVGMIDWLMPEGTPLHDLMELLRGNFTTPSETELIEWATKAVSSQRRTLPRIFTGCDAVPSMAVTQIKPPNGTKWEADMMMAGANREAKKPWNVVNLHLNLIEEWQRQLPIVEVKGEQRIVTEIIVPVIYASDGWTGNPDSFGGNLSATKRNSTETRRELSSIEQSIRVEEKRLRTYSKTGVIDGTMKARPMSSAHVQAVNIHKYDLRAFLKEKVRLESKLQTELGTTAKMEVLMSRLIRERGWKALLMAGMQAMELLTKDQDHE